MITNRINVLLKDRLTILIFTLIVFIFLLVVLIGIMPEGNDESRNFLILIPAAFLSGLLSFISPCSLPILPAYFAYSFQANRKNIVLMTITFFMGLATTMIIFGVSVSLLGSFLVRSIPSLSVVGGLIVIIFGIFSILGKGFSGIQFQDRPIGTLAGSDIYGATFAIGWTACIGPILGAILTLLVTQGIGVIQGVLLSFVYALGLGLPLIIISAFFSKLGNGSKFWKFIRGREIMLRVGTRELSFHTTGMISGFFLVAIGVLLMTGQLTALTQFAVKSDISLWIVEVEEKVRVLLGIQ